MSPVGTGVRSGAPPTWHPQQVEQHQPLEGRRPRNSPAPLTVPEFTYFFFLHFFLGFSTCRHGVGQSQHGVHPALTLTHHPTSYTVN